MMMWLLLPAAISAEHAWIGMPSSSLASPLRLHLPPTCLPPLGFLAKGCAHLRRRTTSQHSPSVAKTPPYSNNQLRTASSATRLNHDAKHSPRFACASADTGQRDQRAREWLRGWSVTIPQPDQSTIPAEHRALRKDWRRRRCPGRMAFERQSQRYVTLQPLHPTEKTNKL